MDIDPFMHQGVIAKEDPMPLDRDNRISPEDRRKRDHEDGRLREIQGSVVNVLKGCGLAEVQCAGPYELTINKGTDGVHFDALTVGQRIACEVAPASRRVVHVHQQTMPMTAAIADMKSSAAPPKVDLDISGE